jgi:dolichol kinase
MMLAIFCVLLLFTSPPVSLATATSVALFESMPLAMSDNLLIPLFTTLFLSVA